MSVVGFDVGNESGIVAVARQRGIDVVLNEESKRETPMVVSFGETQRFIGVAGAASAMMNLKNTVTQVKRFIGRKYKEAEVQADIQLCPFTVKEASDGDCSFEVMFLGERRSFSPTQVLAMLLGCLKHIAEKNLGASVVDCVVGVPCFFTDAQRRAYSDACTIAGLHPLRLMHETAATALAYGIYKTDLLETEPLNVAFVDVGHAHMQVCIAAFKKGQLRILSQAFDRCLGGRDFDEVLFRHFTDSFRSQYGIDVRSNARAAFRLRAACEKAKKILSANPRAPLNIECLMDDKDVRGEITREQFEELATPVLERVRGPCQRALEDAGLTAEQVHVVEVVGSGSRAPAILRILQSAFGRVPSRTMNASECIARGAALQCAMLSPNFRVREFEVQDTYLFPIALSWKQGPAAEGARENEDEGISQPDQIVFTKNNPIPSSKLLTFYRTDPFNIDAFYADTSELPEGHPSKIGYFTIGPFNSKAKGEGYKPKLKVKVRLNLHGIFSTDSAILLDEEEMDVPATRGQDPAAPPMETDSKEERANGVNPEGEQAKGGDAPEPDAAMDEASAGGGTPAPPSEDTMEADTAKATDAAGKETAKKKRVKRVEVPVQPHLCAGMLPDALQMAVEQEYEMALQDRVMEETKDRKNAVEAYVYDMRNKLCDKLQGYVTDAEREEMSAKLQQTEDWLYEDGENESKGVYVAKLEELKKTGDPFEERQREDETRGQAADALVRCYKSYREAAQSADPKYDHIDAGDKAKVIEEASKAESWLQDKQRQQESVPKTAKPVLLSAEINKKAETLDRFCKPIMTKAKPSSAKEEKPARAPEGGSGEPAKNGKGAGGDEPMETDASAKDSGPGEPMEAE